MITQDAATDTPYTNNDGRSRMRSGARSRRRRETIELLAELPLAELCTHAFTFGHAAEAFRAVDEGIPGLMHAVLDYRRSPAGDL